jgi:integrase
MHIPHNPHTPWNKGKLVGQKAPLTQQQVWSIRMRLEAAGNPRNLALFNLAIDSKLRACDLLKLRVCDIANGLTVQSRGKVVQQKTGRPVRFELTSRTKESVASWIQHGRLSSDSFLFPSRQHRSQHLSVRQYARLMKGWTRSIGLDPMRYGTHSMRRTKATLIYRQTKNLRAVQLLLGHSKLDSTVRYLGIEIDDALEMSEQIDV